MLPGKVVPGKGGVADREAVVPQELGQGGHLAAVGEGRGLPDDRDVKGMGRGHLELAVLVEIPVMAAGGDYRIPLHDPAAAKEVPLPFVLHPLVLGHPAVREEVVPFAGGRVLVPAGGEEGAVRLVIVPVLPFLHPAGDRAAVIAEEDRAVRRFKPAAMEPAAFFIKIEGLPFHLRPAG